jgi:DNA-binding transcriptional ArsR family regulator
VTADAISPPVPAAPAEAAGAALAVLGDRTRRAIVELLAERPRAVGELADLLPVTRPAVSLHLRALKDARLVHDTPHGTRRIYELDPQGLALLRTYLDRLWAGALDRFAAAAGAAHRADRDAAGDPSAGKPTPPPTAGPIPKGPTP